MQRRMTKADGLAMKARWKKVNDAEREELRRSSPTLRLRQLSALMALAKELGWHEALAEGESEVRQRWRKLRKAYGV
jgi:hypothetical protein